MQYVFLKKYPCKELTIVSKIKNGKFKTLYAPSHKYLSNDNTHSLNNSTNMSKVYLLSNNSEF